MSRQMTNPPQERPRKRRKIILACNYCRARKTKCDGGQPACSACENKGLGQSCMYEQGALRTQRYVSSLESRLEEYQRRASVTCSESITNVNNSQTGAPECEPSDSTSIQDHVPTTGQDVWSVGIGTDAMVVVSSPEDDSDGTIGKSSPMAFVHSILRAAGGGDTSLRVGSSALPPSIPFTVQQDVDEEAMFLPPRRLADSYTDSFWKFLHPILPLLHKPTFNKSYNSLWEPDKDMPSSILLSTVNIVLAIGCQLSDEAVSAHRLKMSGKLYQRSKRLFTDELLDSPTVSVVQLLLLTGVYLQSTQHANRWGNSIGLAIRAAQSIGLHRDRRPDDRSQLQREMERRVWHACVFLDRQVAITLGRPKMIWARSQVPAPQMIDDEYLLEGGEASQPPHLNPQLGTFVYSTKLFDILDNILVAFYMDKKQKFSRMDQHTMSFEVLSDVLRFNMELDSFSESIPGWLVVPGQPGSRSDPKFEAGAKILYSRLLYIRVFLLRPILLFVAQTSKDSRNQGQHVENRMELKLASEASRLCISTAQRLIAHITDNMSNFYWTSIAHKLHYAFSCAVVFIAARLGPLQGLGTDSEALQASWRRCIELFEYYKPHFPSAAHVLRILEILESRLEESAGPPVITSGESQRDPDPLGRLEGFGLDANWAMLDELLPADWFTTSMTGEFASGED